MIVKFMVFLRRTKKLKGRNVGNIWGENCRLATTRLNEYKAQSTTLRLLLSLLSLLIFLSGACFFFLS